MNCIRLLVYCTNSLIEKKAISISDDKLQIKFLSIITIIIRGHYRQLAIKLIELFTRSF